MSYLEKNLLPDEEIIYRTKKHFIIFFGPALLSIITIILYTSPLPYVGKFAIVPAILVLITGANQLLILLTADFAVTTKRVIMREGFFIRHVNEMRLSTISNISVDQSLIGQALNYGTVIIYGFGDAIDRFSEIDDPNVFKNHLQAQLDKIVSLKK